MRVAIILIMMNGQLEHITADEMGTLRTRGRLSAGGLCRWLSAGGLCRWLSTGGLCRLRPCSIHCRLCACCHTAFEADHHLQRLKDDPLAALTALSAASHVLTALANQVSGERDIALLH